MGLCRERDRDRETQRERDSNTEQERLTGFKELAHVIVKTGRPETSRVGGKLENPGRVCVAALT